MFHSAHPNLHPPPISLNDFVIYKILQMFQRNLESIGVSEFECNFVNLFFDLTVANLLCYLSFRQDRLQPKPARRWPGQPPPPRKLRRRPPRTLGPTEWPYLAAAAHAEFFSGSLGRSVGLDDALQERRRPADPHGMARHAHGCSAVSRAIA